MVRRIVFYKDYFIEFYKGLDDKTKSKFKYVLELIKNVENVPKRFLAPIAGADGLFEIRIEFESNIYRIFCCFDKGRVIVLFNVFQKKSQKTPRKEIKRAIKLMEEYFEC